MSTTVKFYADPDATNISSFNVYRSIRGAISSQEPFDLTDKSFVFRYDEASGYTKIKFSSNDIEEVRDQINENAGIQAYISGVDPNRSLILRGTTKVLELIKTVGLEELSIASGIYRDKQTFVNVGSVAFVSGTSEYTFEDSDGGPFDFYRISEVNASLEEQPPGAIFQAKDNLVPVCRVQGVILSSDSGSAVEGVEVKAKPWLQDESNDWELTKDYVKTYSDENGNWLLTLPRGVRYYIDIPKTKYSNALVIPDQNELLLGDLLVDATWRNDDKPIITDLEST